MVRLTQVLGWMRFVDRPRKLKVYPSLPKFKNTEIPERYKLPPVPKVPSIYGLSHVKCPRVPREHWRLQGEETIQTKLQMEQFGIVALSGGLMKHEHFEVLRNDINRRLEPQKSFAIYRVDPPHKPVTRKGSGKKLGGGKGSISFYVSPIKAGRVIVEVAGKVLWTEVQPWLSYVASKMPFDAIAVNTSILERLEAEEARLLEENENPYTFEWLVRNNMLDCRRNLSPKDAKWFGKFVYLDRENNKKWNTVLQRLYRGHNKSF